MTLNEAIKHCEEVAQVKLKDGNSQDCIQCGKEHLQLAVWLKELKWYKSQTKGEEQNGNSKF